MLNLIPMPYRIAAVVALFVGTFGYGYVKGATAQQEKDDERFEQIRIVQDRQAIHAGQIALARQMEIGAIADSFAADKRRLAAAYARRLREQTAGRVAGAVPAGQVPAGTDAEAADDGLARYIELEARCAETTAQLINLQKAARAVEGER